jgi:asparagine synthase (glutamine-hydrolysing)
MCGIAGIYSRSDQPIPAPRLLAMRDEQSHRGPDASGLHVAARIGLASNRLAILDLTEAANQPMLSDDRSIALVFNGEIYNFQDVRRDLEAKDRRFRTRGDTEVILRGYEEWGAEVFSRLNGMFAVALWDGPRERLLLVRDRVGKKPLHYADAGGEVVFASELRALVKGLRSSPEVDAEAVDLYMAYHCVPGDRSIYRGISKVPPGSILSCDRDGVRLSRFWRVSYQGKQPLRQPEALEQLDALLADATRIRMISDVPVGAFLSGGVDSSTVVALMSRQRQPVRTFTVTLPDSGMNEAPFARTVSAALGTEHEEVVVEASAASVLPALVWHFGEPFADSSAVPTYHLSAAARRRVTVVLNGDGGDEGFAGYEWHRSIPLASLYRGVCPRILRQAIGGPARWVVGLRPAPEMLRAAARFASRWGSRDSLQAFWIWPGLEPGGRQELYARPFLQALNGHDPRRYARAAWSGADGADDLDRALQAGIETYLPDDLLVKMDIASMAHSLEARSPLLDHRVLEFAARLPTALKIRGMETKPLLKAYAERLVPSSVVYRSKQGFSIPLSDWLRGPLKRPLESLLRDKRFAARGFLDPKAVQSCLNRHLSGDDFGPLLWAVLWLELWFRMFVDGDVHRGDSLYDLA